MVDEGDAENDTLDVIVYNTRYYDASALHSRVPTPPGTDWPGRDRKDGDEEEAAAATLTRELQTGKYFKTASKYFAFPFFRTETF